MRNPLWRGNRVSHDTPQGVVGGSDIPTCRASREPASPLVANSIALSERHKRSVMHAHGWIKFGRRQVEDPPRALDCITAKLAHQQRKYDAVASTGKIGDGPTITLPIDTAPGPWTKNLASPSSNCFRVIANRWRCDWRPQAFIRFLPE
jgi:hypothetical protein